MIINLDRVDRRRSSFNSIEIIVQRKVVGETDSIGRELEIKRVRKVFLEIKLIEVGNIEYGNFENCNFDSDLKSKI